MAHASAEPKPRRGITLTQQIFIGLALGILAGWIVSETTPRRPSISGLSASCSCG